MIRSYSVKFVEVTAKATRTGECPVCEKKVRRQRTFMQTVNPYNVIEDPETGVNRPKTYAEVQQAVQMMANAWKPDPAILTHEKCR